MSSAIRGTQNENKKAIRRVQLNKSNPVLLGYVGRIETFRKTENRESTLVRNASSLVRLEDAHKLLKRLRVGKAAMPSGHENFRLSGLEMCAGERHDAVALADD